MRKVLFDLTAERKKEQEDRTTFFKGDFLESVLVQRGIIISARNAKYFIRLLLALAGPPRPNARVVLTSEQLDECIAIALDLKDIAVDVVKYKKDR